MKVCVLFSLLLLGLMAGTSLADDDTHPKFGAIIVGGDTRVDEEDELRLDGQYHRLFPLSHLSVGPQVCLQVEDKEILWMLGGHVHVQPLPFLGVSATLGFQPSDGFDPILGYAAHFRVLQYLNPYVMKFIQLPPVDLMIGQRDGVTVFGASIGAGSSGE
ncbi:MAG: hypothetical protein H6760_01620 [Candidatus Nomurabacteria bacterium]|nr:MAG: hypothetical protein H6760_01620 [Candidatus Nomurabacteria bacterium]